MNRTEREKIRLKKYHEEHKERRNAWFRARHERIRNTIDELKLERGCSFCGYKKCARALQFHHEGNDKEHDIGRLVGQGRKIEVIFKEIEKCILLCANCHAEIHARGVSLVV